MKKHFLIITLLAFQQLSYGNDSIPEKKIVFKTKVFTTDGKMNVGYLNNIDDSTISLTTKPLAFGTTAERQTISYPDISYMDLKRKGSVGRGVLYGSLSGVTLGMIIGFAMGDDPPETWFGMTAAEKALLTGAGLGLLGAATGALVGTLIKHTFRIDKNKENFSRMKTNILDRVYGANPKH